MGSLGWFFFFLNLRGIKIYIRKKLLGFGWIPLDPGNRQWKRRGRGNHCSSREDGAAGEGAGGLFYGVGHMPPRVTLCKTLGVLICLDQNTRGTGGGTVYAICDKWVLRKPGLAITIICCW